MKQCLLLFLLSAAGVIIGGSTIKNPAVPENPMKMRKYSQEIELSFANEKDAKKALLAFAPLPDNKEWVFSARWDDNNRKNLKMRDLMEKYGYKGTFYLNSNYWWNKKGSNFGADYAKKLMKGGCTIGGHSMTHPPLSKITRNEMFYEIAAIKVEREVDTDTLLSSFAFPGGNFQNPFDRNAHPDIGRALKRCNFHHNTYSSFVNPNNGVSPEAFSTVCCFSPGDRDTDCAKFDVHVANILKNKKLKKTIPNITLGVHVWHTEKGWENLEKSLKKYANNPKWLYCNQNVYAAYRYQFKHSKLEKVSQDGKTVRYKLTRLNAADLGENIPLTIIVENAKPVSVSVDGAKVAVSGDFFNVPHNEKEKAPAIIDAMNNPLNLPEVPKGLASSKIPGLVFFLYYDKKEDCLKLRCENKSDKAVEKMHVTFRLPLLYKEGIINMDFPGVKPGASQTVRLPLPQKETASEYDDGKRYFMAQIDFLYGDKICRFYATAREQKEKPDLISCPRDTAIVSNPMAENGLDLGELQRLSAPSSKLSGVIIPGWRKAGKQDSFKFGRKYVNIAIQDRKKRQQFKNKSFYVAVFEDIKVDKDNLSISCLTGKNKPAYIFLNGKRLEPSKQISGLKRGVNRLALVFKINDLRTTMLVLDFSPGNEMTLQRPF
jgi:peptidoglycan/xylan/chitin deacetylase (PgdA/CDA1 family)